jgi:geranylgeranyl pyrophosphate synthase
MTRARFVLRDGRALALTELRDPDAGGAVVDCRAVLFAPDGAAEALPREVALDLVMGAAEGVLSAPWTSLRSFNT